MRYRSSGESLVYLVRVSMVFSLGDGLGPRPRHIARGGRL